MAYGVTEGNYYVPTFTELQNFSLLRLYPCLTFKNDVNTAIRLLVRFDPLIHQLPGFKAAIDLFEQPGSYECSGHMSAGETAFAGASYRPRYESCLVFQ